MAMGGKSDLLRRQRKTMEEFTVDGEMIRLTDQKPIIEANIAFQDNWTLADLIEAINRRVFFWRGSAAGLLSNDQGHFGKYCTGHSLVFLRMGLQETIQLNIDRGPEVCKYNSGAARMYNGQPIPRGLTTFVSFENASFGIGNVREVVFREFVDIPSCAMFCEGSWRGPWQKVWQGRNET